MSHRHLCDVTGHMWECDGTAVRLGQDEPTVCTCHSCRLPLEHGAHSRCKNLVELLACSEHRDEQLRRRQEAEKEFERRAAEFGFDEKWARMKALPVGPEKHALAEEIVEWLFGDDRNRGQQAGAWRAEAIMQAMDASDEQLWEACRRLDSDWEPVGQRKWPGRPESRPDCATCCWFPELFRNWPDWGVCANPESPRAGLLTNWEQGCWQFEPEKGERREETLRTRSSPMNCFERALREQAGSFIEQQVRLANDPSPEDEPPAVPEDIRGSFLFILLRRLLRRGGFRRQDVDEAAARARWDSSRYWEYARRYWARTLGEDVSAIPLPMNTWELEEQFWVRVDRIIHEALAGGGMDPDGEAP